MIYLRTFLVVTLLFAAGCTKHEESTPKGLAKEAVDSRTTELPGRIVFISNRDGNRSEVWIFEKGKIRKILSKNDSENPMPQEIPSFFGGAFNAYRHPKLIEGGKLYLQEGHTPKIFQLESGQSIPVSTEKTTSSTTSEDGETIIFTKLDKSKGGGGSANIYTYITKSGQIDKVTDLSSMPGTRRISHVAVSNDFSKVAYTMSGEEKYGTVSVWAIDADGGDNKLIAKAAHGGAFSPDGKKLAYASPLNQQGERIHQQSKIFIYDFEVGESRQITFGPWSDRDAVFSPDGKWICYVSYRHVYPYVGSELYALNLETGEEIQITPAQKIPGSEKDPGRGWTTDETPHWGV